MKQNKLMRNKTKNAHPKAAMAPGGQPGLECALLGMRRVCAAHGCKAGVEDPESGPHQKAAMVPTPFYFKGSALGVCAPHQPINKR